MEEAPSTRAMEVFSEAATSDAADLGQYLDRACEGDEQLRREVESLLAARRRMGGFLDSPTLEGEEVVAADEVSRRDADAIEGARSPLGRYRIEERMGEGGFGVVYRASQTYPIRREVAMKIVKLGMDSRHVIARFESERQALALMDHPHIARIFDAGATADARPYFAMELVRGLPITEYCDTNRLTIPRRLELFIAVCQGVQHAHLKGVIHRDLKPSNILVAVVDGKPVPKVIDFGIAKAMSPASGQHTAHTELRHFLGTPQYMSPEQAGAGGGDIDTRSDVYSLGILLYELLTGTTPFDPQALRQVSYDRLHRMIREEDAPAPCARLKDMGPPLLAEAAARRGIDGQKLIRIVGGELEWIVGKALEKDRRRRYETASALSDDVRRYLANEAVGAGPVDAMYRVRKFATRHSRALGVAGAIAVALLAGLTAMTFGLVRAKRDGDRAERALRQAEQLSTFLAEMLRSADPDRSKGSQLLVRDVLDRTSRDLDRGSLRDQPLVEAGIRMALGGSYESLGLFAEAESQHRVALSIRQRHLGKEDLETARSMAAMAMALHNRADYDAAEAMARQALAIREKVLGAEHPEVIETLLRLGTILRAKWDAAGSEATLRRAVTLSRRIGDRHMLARVSTNLGVALMDKGDDAAAEPLLREALELDRQLHGEKFRNVPRNLSNLAVILEHRGDFSAAEGNWIEALRIQRELLPPDHPDIAWTLRLLGRVKHFQGDEAAAEKYGREGLEMERRLFGTRHPVIADFLDDLVKPIQAQGRRDEAVALRKEALDIRLAHKKSALAANPKAAGHRGAVGELHLRRGEFAEAKANIDEAARLDPRDPRWRVLSALLHSYLEGKAGSGAEPGSNMGTNPQAAQFYLALARLRATDLPQAIELFTKSRDSAPDAATRGAAGCYLAIALKRQGKDSESAAAFAAALEELRKLPEVADGDIGAECEEWLMSQIAQREAELTLRPPPAEAGRRK